MNWQAIGSTLAGVLVSTLLSVAICSLAFRRYIAPEFVEALNEAQKAASTLASLGGLKKAEWQDGKQVEKLVAADIIKNKIPELQALKLVVDSDTWDQIENLIQEHPDQAMALYQKYGHLIPGGQDAQEQTMF